MALGSGAARGWAHIGVLKGLAEIGVRPDVVAGCSVGALVGGAYLVGGLEAFMAWARELSPLSALTAFNFNVGRGGLVDTKSAFEAFRQFDRDMGELETRFGAVATDLGTGDEVWITEGSVLEAARASSAIPALFHAVKRADRWLVDGALANPTPVSLARGLGADVVLAVDLNAVPRVLHRFNPPPPGPPAVVPPRPATDGTLGGAVGVFIEETRRRVEDQLALSKARQQAKPQLLETAMAAVDIFQMHLSKARRLEDAPDLCLEPDMRDALPTSFDRADEFIEIGRKALLDRQDELRALLAAPGL